MCINLDELKATSSSCSGKPAEDADIDTDSVTSIIMETKVEEDAVSRVSSVQGKDFSRRGGGGTGGRGWVGKVWGDQTRQG